MAKRRLALIWACMVMVLPLQAEEPVPRLARLTATLGQVRLTKSATPKYGEILGKALPMRLKEGDSIETGPKSQADVKLDNETIFHLHAGSRIKIKKLYARNTQLEFSKGTVAARVHPATSTGASLILKMPNAVVAVRSAEFVAETGGGLSQAAVFGGHVIVAGAWGHEHVKLGPNQETMVTLSAVPKPPHKLVHFKGAKRFFLNRRNK